MEEARVAARHQVRGQDHPPDVSAGSRWAGCCHLQGGHRYAPLRGSQPPERRGAGPWELKNPPPTQTTEMVAGEWVQIEVKTETGWFWEPPPGPCSCPHERHQKLPPFPRRSVPGQPTTSSPGAAGPLPEQPRALLDRDGDGQDPPKPAQLGTTQKVTPAPELPAGSACTAAQLLPGPPTPTSSLSSPSRVPVL